jgi:hypothetical protein
MPRYFPSRLQQVLFEGQLQQSIGGEPDLIVDVGSTGWGIAVQLVIPSGAGFGDFAQAWAQPSIVANALPGASGSVSHLPLGGKGQLIIPGPVYCWSRRDLSMDALAATASPGLQIDLGVALWRRSRGGALLVNAWRVT